MLADAKGPIIIAGSAYEIHNSDVAMAEPVRENTLISNKKFIMFIVNCDNNCENQRYENLLFFSTFK